MSDEDLVKDTLQRMQMRHYGEQPRPRLLVAGYEESFADAVSDIFPTVRLLRERWDEVDHGEFDAVVGPNSLGGSDRRLCALDMSSVCDVTPDLRERSKDVRYAPPIAFDKGEATVSKVFLVPDEVPESVRQLVGRRLIPLLIERPSNPSLQWNMAGLSLLHRQALPPVQSVLRPLVMTKDGKVLAGTFDRQRGQAECWAIPDDSPEAAEDWLRVAVEVWRERWPDRFPLAADWRNDSKWRTPEEEGLAQELQRVRDERSETLRKLDRAEAEIEERLAKLAADADVHERKLLTASGPELADAVRSCLQDLGFRVENADATATKGGLLEDLRVEDPSVDGWVALVEVKGYKGGAKVTDLGGFTRLTRRYMEANEGRPPSAIWYVVNQFRGRNPSEREPILASNEVELASFAKEDQGVAIDTASLYRLRRAIVMSAISAEDARRALRDATGRFEYP